MKMVNSPEGDYHPNAVDMAESLIRRGYVQSEPSKLDDQEDVIMVDGRNGLVAPGRYHKYGPIADEGRRERDVLEAFPDSPHAVTIPWHKTLAQSQEGEPFERLALFRLTAPEHALHGQALYANREAQHRDVRS